MNINNFLHSILIINKIANSNLPSEIKKLFELNTNDKNIQASVVRDGLIKCIKNQELLNDSALIKLNNNVFYKNEKIKHIINKLNISTISSSKSIYNPTSSLEDIRNSMIEYIQSSFINMDIYFIWNLCSIIFNINIIIFELEFKGNTLQNNLKCPLLNNYKLYEFDKKRKKHVLFLNLIIYINH